MIPQALTPTGGPSGSLTPTLTPTPSYYLSFVDELENRLSSIAIWSIVMLACVLTSILGILVFFVARSAFCGVKQRVVPLECVDNIDGDPEAHVRMIQPPFAQYCPPLPASAELGSAKQAASQATASSLRPGAWSAAFIISKSAPNPADPFSPTSGTGGPSTPPPPPASLAAIVVDPADVAAGRTALHAAAKSNSLEAVKAVLQTGFAYLGDTGPRRLTESVDVDGRTPLHLAAASGSELIVNLLLQAGADAAAVDAQRRTPLDYAIETGAEDVVRVLEPLFNVVGQPVAAGSKLVRDIVPAPLHDFK